MNNDTRVSDAAEIIRISVVNGCSMRQSKYLSGETFKLNNKECKYLALQFPFKWQRIKEVFK